MTLFIQLIILPQGGGKRERGGGKRKNSDGWQNPTLPSPVGEGLVCLTIQSGPWGELLGSSSPASCQTEALCPSYGWGNQSPLFHSPTDWRISKGLTFLGWDVLCTQIKGG